MISPSLRRSGLCLLVLLAGCAAPARNPALDASIPPLDAEQHRLDERVAELDAKIARLEGRLGAGEPRGTGAYAHGTTLRVQGEGRESVLERLRRLERELAAAQAEKTVKDSTITELSRRRDEALTAGRTSAERADYLDRVRGDLVTSQQTLAERQERIAALNAALATGELQRLRAERRWYGLAGEVLRLSPDDARDLPEIQSRIREATREVREEPRKDAAAAGERSGMAETAP